MATPSLNQTTHYTIKEFEELDLGRIECQLLQAYQKLLELYRYILCLVLEFLFFLVLHPAFVK